MGWVAVCMAGMCPNTWVVAGRKKGIWKVRGRKWRQIHTSCEPTSPDGFFSWHSSNTTNNALNLFNTHRSTLSYTLWIIVCHQLSSPLSLSRSHLLPVYVSPHCELLNSWKVASLLSQGTVDPCPNPPSSTHTDTPRHFFCPGLRHSQEPEAGLGS